MIVKIVCITALFILTFYFNFKMYETIDTQKQIIYAVETLSCWQALLLMVCKF